MTTIPLNNDPYVSDSNTYRAENCPASQALPRVPRRNVAADAGNAGHDIMELRGTKWRNETEDEAEDICDRWGLVGVDRDVLLAKMRRFEWIPPAGCITERPLAWHSDGTVIEILGGRGKYELPAGTWGPGTVDLMWSEPEPIRWVEMPASGSRVLSLQPRCPEGSTLLVLDYKTGEDKYVSPVDVNPQLASGAAKAAAWTGATKVVPIVLFITGKEGVWDTAKEPWGPERLLQAKARVRAIHEAAMSAKWGARRAELSSPREGVHCWFCDSFTHCPAKVDLVRRAVLGQEPWSGDANTPMDDLRETMTGEQAAKVVEVLSQFQRVTTNMRELLQAHVQQHGPVELGGGLQWGQVEGPPKVKLVTHLALPILRTEIGEAAMDIFEGGKGRLYEVVKAHLEGQNIKRKGASTARRLLERLLEAKAAYHEPNRKYTAFRVDEDANEEDFEI
jgi:hypothetical protein